MEILGFSLLAIAFVWFSFEQRERYNRLMERLTSNHADKVSAIKDITIQSLDDRLKAVMVLRELEARRAEEAEAKNAELNKRAVEQRALPFYIRTDAQEAKEEQLLRELAENPSYQDEVPGLGR